MDNVLWKKCEICNNLFEIKLISNKNNLNYGKPIKIHEHKRFCSKKCQNEWQRNIKWEERIGLENANKIRKESSQRVSGNNNPSTKKEISKKISESMKKYLLKNPRLKEKNGMYNKKHTEEYKKKSSENKKGKWSYDIDGYNKLLQNTPKGENHPNWLGGISNLPYPFGFNKKLKTKIKERDNYSCVICNKKTQKLSIHHINYDKNDINEKNLVSLCVKCHSITNYNRNNWLLFFNNKTNEIYKK